MVILQDLLLESSSALRQIDSGSCRETDGLAHGYQVYKPLEITGAPDNVSTDSVYQVFVL